MWFADGTFKSLPSIFYQAFAILGSATQSDWNGEPQTIGLPFVYALLSSKEEAAYTKKLLKLFLKKPARCKLK